MAYTKKSLLSLGIIFLILGCLIGFHLNSTLSLHKNVNPNIFIIFGITTIIVGFLYVAPPASLYKHVGGEVILFEGLSIIPILGAYLVQTGDLTRTVYIASIPVMVSTALWVWLTELVSLEDDLKTGRNTMIMIFPLHYANRIVPVLLTILIYLTLVGANIARSSLNPASLLGLLSAILGFKIVSASWNSYANSAKMVKALRNSFLIHFFICMIICISSLLTFFHR